MLQFTRTSNTPHKNRLSSSPLPGYRATVGKARAWGCGFSAREARGGKEPTEFKLRDENANYLSSVVSLVSTSKTRPSALSCLSSENNACRGMEGRQQVTLCRVKTYVLLAVQNTDKSATHLGFYRQILPGCIFSSRCFPNGARGW